VLTWGGTYHLWVIPDLVIPLGTTLLWSASGAAVIRSIAISPNGTLYGGHVNGQVYKINWDTGALEGVIPGFPTMPGDFESVPRLWFTFDLTGSTLYMPMINSTVQYVAACYLENSSINLTLQAPSSNYAEDWSNVYQMVFYGMPFVYL
jgi:hypothetical protein